MEALLPYLPVITLAVLSVLVLAYQVALGQGQTLANEALAFLLNEAQATLDRITRQDLDLAVAWLYNLAPATVWVIPWKAFVSLTACQSLAWAAYERAHAFADTADAQDLKRAVVKDRVVRGRVR